jgi:hypothetical protein
MQADKFQFTAAAAAVATAAANTEKFVADYLISNHSQNNKNHLIAKNTLVIDNFSDAAAAAATAAAYSCSNYYKLASHCFFTNY